MSVTEMRGARDAQFLHIWLLAATLAVVIIGALVAAVVATSGGGY